MSQLPWVLLITNPYEGELCRRALGGIGLRVVVSEGGEGALGHFDGEAPLLVILALGLVHADALALLEQIRDRLPAAPVFLLADRDGVVPDEDAAARLGAHRLFLRPIDAAALADATERVAIEAELSVEVAEELSQLTNGAELTPAPGPLPVPQAVFGEQTEKNEIGQAKEGGSTNERRPERRTAPRLSGEGFTDLSATSPLFMRADEALPDPIGPIPFSVSETTSSRREVQSSLESPSAVPPRIAPLPATIVGEPKSDDRRAPTSTGHPPRSEPKKRPKSNLPQMTISTTAEPLPEAGSLSRIDVAELLGALYSGAFTGRLLLHRGDGERRIFFEGGVPVFATSTFGRERLADLLWREGKLSREQYSRASEHLGERSGRRAATELVERSLIKPSEIFPLLRQQLEEVLYASFALTEGDYELGLEQAGADDRLRLSVHPFSLYLEGVRRKYGLDRLADLVGPFETVLSPTPLLPRFVAEGQLSPSERMVVALLDGERTLAEVRLAMSAAPSGALGDTELYALAWALGVMGAAVFDEKTVPDRGSASAASPRASKPGDRRASERIFADRPSDQAVDRDRVLAKHSQVLDGDYFTILGVERHASVHEIRRAFERLHLDFSPDRFSESVRNELAEALAEIQEVLVEARRVLLDEEIREQYRLHLPD